MMSAKTAARESQPLRVGFDLDGVILYNPARIIRPLIATAKKVLFHKQQTKFRIPKTRWEKLILKILHQSSLFIAPGFDEIKLLTEKKQIDAYLITARYGFLRKDYEKWLRRLNSKNIFTAAFMNDQDEQPHLFKERMINKLNLDVFVDDNWDIISYLKQRQQKGHQHADPIWIYNIFDHNISYQPKFPSLKSTVNYVQQQYLDQD